MKSWYQIDIRNESENGALENYEMVKSNNMENALKEYLGEYFADYKVTKTTINGRPMLTAKCPEQTANYYEVQRAIQSN